MAENSNIPSWFCYPEYDWKQKHAVVIGAGVAGCQMAWHLVQQGWQVTLIEREKKIAQQASGNPAGIISPKMTAKASSGEDFYVSCFKYAVEQLNQLKHNHVDLDWHDCGLLQLAHNERELQRWKSLKSRSINKEFDDSFLQLTDRKQSSEISGIPLDFEASFFPQAGWINPVSFCQTLLKDCGENCQLILESDALSLKQDSNSWQVIDQHNKTMASAEVIIITSGKDLNQFSQTKNLPSMPVAGQTTIAPTNNFASRLKTTIGHEGYLTPASTISSQLTFGASFERNVKEAMLSAKTDKANLNQLSKYLPQLADSFAETNSAHTAVRMTTPDRFPYVGGIADTQFYKKNYHDLHQGKQYKDYPKAEYLNGLFVLGGLGSRGLTTSGLCASILSEIICRNLKNKQEDSKTELFQTIQQYCHPARYLIKDLKRGK